MKEWNRADGTLLLAFLAFLLALAIHLHAPHALWADGLLFAAEGALVGGVADWFAVTALFRKPLGFPYHTAILPRRRLAFINASVRMVQKEIFSRRKIFHHLERIHFLPMLLGWLEKEETRIRLTQGARRYIERHVLSEHSALDAGAMAQKIRRTLLKLPPEQFFVALGGWLQRSGRDKVLLAALATAFRERVETPAMHKAIEAWLTKYEEERTESDGAWILSWIAKATNIVNMEEAAALLQKQLVSLLKRLAEEDSPLQQEVLAIFYERARTLGEDAAFSGLVQELYENLVADLPLEKALQEAWSALRSRLSEQPGGGELDAPLPMLRSRLTEILEQEYARALVLLKEDEALRGRVGHFLYELIARSALHAQTLIGIIVERVLSRLTDAELNRLVYDKVAPDLIWIRINGVLLGTIIACLVFALSHIFSY